MCESEPYGGDARAGLRDIRLLVLRCLSPSSPFLFYRPSFQRMNERKHLTGGVSGSVEDKRGDGDARCFLYNAAKQEDHN